MKFLFVMDPMARLQIAGDSTFAIMLAAQARGHEIWFCEPRHLSLEHADAVARAWPVTVRRVMNSVSTRRTGSADEKDCRKREVSSGSSVFQIFWPGTIRE